MNYEKLYKEALERAEILKKTCGNLAIIGWCEHIFPELKESEDERIRKVLVRWFEVGARGSETFNGIPTDKILAWLEKQGEHKLSAKEDEVRRVSTIQILEYAKSLPDYNQFGKDDIDKNIAWLKKQSNNAVESTKKFIRNYGNWYYDKKQSDKPQGKTALEAIKEKPVDNANKAEPKFKVGDWIIRSAEGFKHDTYLVIDVKNYYVCKDLNGKGATFTFNDAHKHFTLWTIQESKDGDVLCVYECDEPKIVFILKGSPKKHYALSYHCYYNIMYPYFESSSKKGCLAPKDEDIKPATKEQRTLLFEKMKEAGLVWNSDKKILHLRLCNL